MRWIEEHVGRRVLFITAEAGYGKTTLLADWAQRSTARVAWLRLDEDDATWVSFVRYLVAAVRELDREFGATTSLLLDELAAGANNRPVVEETLAQELGDLAASARLVVVLDDFHHAEPVAEVRNFVGRLLNGANTGLTFVIASRRRSAMSLSRLRAMGEVADLRRNDLRFRQEETQELFRESYRRLLEADLLHEIAKRTEGWAASLQLVETAIRGRSPEEARALVSGITGGRGEFYDYLAEEVVGDLAPDLQSFLMRTALLRIVTPEFAGLVTGLTDRDLHRTLEAVRRLNLLDSGIGQTEESRYHPLVREFLESRLRAEEGDAVVNGLHRQLAEWAEPTDWRTAAHHYERIGATDDLQRVLVDNAPTIMARGEFDIAKSYVDRLGNAPANPIMQLFVSRVELDNDNYDAALRHARAAYEGLAPDDPLFPLATANLASVTGSVGNLEESRQLAVTLVEQGAPPRLASIARGLILAVDVTSSGDLNELHDLLRTMESSQREARDNHYLAITLLNEGVLALPRGDAELAVVKSAEAIRLLAVGGRRLELTAARMSHAWGLAHVGHWEQAASEIADVLSSTDGIARNEALIEAAFIWTRYGDAHGARRLINLARSDRHPSMMSPSSLPLVEAELACRGLEANALPDFVAAIPTNPSNAAPAYSIHRRYVEAYAAAVLGQAGAAELTAGVQHQAQLQHAAHYERCAALLGAAIRDDASFDRVLLHLSDQDPSCVTTLAEFAVARIDGLSNQAAQLVANLAAAHTLRWRDALRAELANADHGQGGLPTSLRRSVAVRMWRCSAVAPVPARAADERVNEASNLHGDWRRGCSWRTSGGFG